MTLTNNLEAKNINLISKNEYRNILRKELPESCFKTDKSHLIAYFIAMTIFITGLNLASSNIPVLFKIPISFIMGVSLTTLTFFLHDLMHGSMFKSKTAEYIFGLSVGLFNFFSPTFWKRIHNFHHARTGDIDDPDRSYILSERPNNFISRLSYKIRISNEAYNKILAFLFMAFGFVFYFGNGFITGLFNTELNAKYGRTRELFKTKDKVKVLLEVVMIVLFQTYLFKTLFNGNLLNFYLGSILPLGIAHTFAMMYIHTNHFLSPLTGSIDDPLINSLSIKDNKFVDAIFLNFSHHVEHHLFPGISSIHYPRVRALIYKHFPERYQILTMKDALTRLFSTPRVYNSYTSLVGIKNDGIEYNCLLPKTSTSLQQKEYSLSL